MIETYTAVNLFMTTFLITLFPNNFKNKSLRQTPFHFR
jgi:hypothetical protein